MQQTVRAPIQVLRVNWRRRLGAGLLAVAAVLTFASLMALLGAWRDDAAIDSRTGRATAEVVSSTFGRTIIRFTTPDGAVRSPQRGVLYPRGLEPGQLIRVEYDVANPDLVRVADRGFELGLLPIALTVVGIWVLLAPPALWLWRRSPRGRKAATPGTTPAATPTVTLGSKSGADL